MIGPLLNALGILAGALFFFTTRQSLPARTQRFLKNALGACTVFFGLQLVWLSLGGGFRMVFKQCLVVMLAVVLGNWVGRLLRLQALSNRAGRFAAQRLGQGQAARPSRPTDGLIALTLLFCAAPLGWLGAVADGLSGYFQLLAVKAVMDGLATAGLLQTLRWPAALAAAPVYLFLNLLGCVVHYGALPRLEPLGLVDPINATAGLITCATALVIFEVRRVELANYLPALVAAPCLAWWFR